nr:MAG: hypothetical protein [Bacteriophage sp.]
MQEIKLIIHEVGGKVNLRVEGMPSDVHTRLASPAQNVTVAERLALVAMDATINALEGFGLSEGDGVNAQ